MHSVNFHEVGRHHDFPAVVKLLAREFVDGASYFTTAKWLEQLSPLDLEMMLEQSELINDSEQALRMFLILVEMLVVAEGESGDIELSTQRTSYLLVILVLEKLYRQGLIEFDRSAISFGEKEMHNVVAWPAGTPKPTIRRSVSDDKPSDE